MSSESVSIRWEIIYELMYRQYEKKDKNIKIVKKKS
jgi:hypothetical protein